ncbi:MAG: hypothetical protein CBHOC_5420, partial [uncultured Caballeronia sp.]
RKFIHGLNVELQEGLATTRIDTFGDAIEMAQRLESAKVLVKNFQAKRKGVSSSGGDPGEQSTPPSKFSRGMGGEGSEGSGGIPRGAHSQEELARGSQFNGPPTGRDSSEIASQRRQSVDYCGYCGRAGHTVKTCWKKTRKCFQCGSPDHQIAECPIKKDEEGASGSGERPKVPARVYALDKQGPNPSDEAAGTFPGFTN